MLMMMMMMMTCKITIIRAIATIAVLRVSLNFDGTLDVLDRPFLLLGIF